MYANGDYNKLHHLYSIVLMDLFQFMVKLLKLF